MNAGWNVDGITSDARAIRAARRVVQAQHRGAATPRLRGPSFPLHGGATLFKCP